jgi:ATP-dependent protease Clp ATPase subunit
MTFWVSLVPRPACPSRRGPSMRPRTPKVETMERVAIVGCGGSGKSYLARQLGRILQAPVTHLDAVFYDD